MTAEEIAAWRRAAEHVVVPFDRELGVTSQSDGFTRYRRWDFAATPPDQYPLLLHYPYYLLYSSQVVKQADLVFALYLCGDYFDLEQKRRDFLYYEAITVRDSSLSASIQAIVAAEIGHFELAYNYLRETAFVDIWDLPGNAEDGLHLASLAGAWLAVVAGFGGLRDHDEVLALSPRLPPQLTRLRFSLVYRGRHIRVDIGPEEARYELRSGGAVRLLHHGMPITLEPARPQAHSYTMLEPPPPVAPPPRTGAVPGATSVRTPGAHQQADSRASGESDSYARPRRSIRCRERLHGLLVDDVARWCRTVDRNRHLERRSRRGD